MKHFILGIGVCLATASAFSAPILQETFTPAQNGTLPASLLASYDGGTDVKVVPLNEAIPAPPADHTGGDGHVLRIGDLGSGGGGYNWAYPAGATSYADTTVSAYVYVDWSTLDPSPTPGPTERDFMLMNRLQLNSNGNFNPQTGTSVRQGYMFMVQAYSSWAGVDPNPANFVPLLLKRVGTSQVKLAEGITAVAQGWHYLQLVCAGSNIKCLIDGAVVFNVTDTQYTTGGFAIGTYDDNGSALTPTPFFAHAFDNLVWDQPAPVSGVKDWSLFQ